ncbi:unnamed protein product [Didymodactylos carnosus]|uniref:Uncharacterized protein n=1 Tax=Didymodactylos carnosus TaxID=1234261 RepID=A0A814YMW4_9BILA|nr:unnamed protein product [Didymodactylos carnosus]CAF1264510.1 unnamed protein product [Didymodactylos carnosus]CAF3993957.1 unnamed protein product [Didymodactylos carnosus]CAF4070812.1 unnamed protein product [Didymodactylos carnosus]
MDEQIRIALTNTKEQYRKGLGLRKEVRRAKRQQDEFKLIDQYQSPPVQDSRLEAKEQGQQQASVTTSNTDEEYLKSNHKIIRNDVVDVENDSIEDDNILHYYLQDTESDLDANVGCIVELPLKLRYRRFNMALISIWVGYTEPLANLWFGKIIDKLNYIKSQNICVSPDLNYKLKFFGVTGDCPAIKLILDFVGHGGYWCCWICYLKGIHVDNKRQYHCELPIKHRHSEKYLQESIQAVQENRDIFGHRGVGVLHKILDTPLPECIIIDYLHCT